MPESLQGLLDKQVDLAGPDTAELLSAAALQGDAFTAAEVAAAQPRQRVECLLANLARIGHLIEPTANGVTSANRLAQTPLRFVHSTFRRHLAGRVTPSDASICLQRLVRAAGRRKARMDPSYALRLAHCSGSAGLPDEAHAWGQRAFDGFVGRYDLASARRASDAVLRALQGRAAEVEQVARYAACRRWGSRSSAMAASSRQPLSSTRRFPGPRQATSRSCGCSAPNSRRRVPVRSAVLGLLRMRPARRRFVWPSAKAIDGSQRSSAAEPARLASHAGGTPDIARQREAEEGATASQAALIEGVIVGASGLRRGSLMPRCRSMRCRSGRSWAPANDVAWPWVPARAVRPMRWT